MTKPFREHHILVFLEGLSSMQLPLDLCLRMYFSNNKAIGSKDRSYIADTIYGMIRWLSLIDYICDQDTSWENRLHVYLQTDLLQCQLDESIPLHIRNSFPKSLFDLIIKSYSTESGCEICRVSNQNAPLTIRINPLRTTREFLLNQWNSLYEVSPCQQSNLGITFHKKVNLFTLPEFKAGLFEVQDEGSQLLSSLVQPCPGQLVMDYCSGSGGKTLAFAHSMKGTGQIYLHDIRPRILLEARRRLKRAGIQNAQVIQSEEPKLKKLKKKMDWVLVDAPCSGTGTLRRNPDMKWKFSEEMLARLIGQQRVIFEKALSFLKPHGGRIVYGTCSLLQEENQEQIKHFMKTYGLHLEGEIFQSLPAEGGMDGFFGAVLML